MDEAKLSTLLLAWSQVEYSSREKKFITSRHQVKAAPGPPPKVWHKLVSFCSDSLLWMHEDLRPESNMAPQAKNVLYCIGKRILDTANQVKAPPSLPGKATEEKKQPKDITSTAAASRRWWRTTAPRRRHSPHRCPLPSCNDFGAVKRPDILAAAGSIRIASLRSPLQVPSHYKAPPPKRHLIYIGAEARRCLIWNRQKTERNTKLEI